LKGLSFIVPPLSAFRALEYSTLMAVPAKATGDVMLILCVEVAGFDANFSHSGRAGGPIE